MLLFCGDPLNFSYNILYYILVFSNLDKKTIQSLNSRPEGLNSLVKPPLSIASPFSVPLIILLNAYVVRSRDWNRNEKTCFRIGTLKIFCKPEPKLEP